MGVDVFFVISGYLITQLLLREARNTGQIDLWSFWARRVRRILPAATLVLCATILIAALLTPTDMRVLGRHAIAAALSYYNWRQAAMAVDYLAQSDSDNPLMHYWSLSVEEQFYLAWPPLLAGVIFFGGSFKFEARVARLAAALLAASFAYSLYLTEADPPLAFFSTFTRSWQLLAGAVVAMVGVNATRLPAELVSGIAAAALLASFFAIDGSTPYPGLAAAVPTAATAALLYCGAAQATRVSRALSVAPARFLGRVSYSWYLWHWPILVLLEQALLRDQMAPYLAAILAIAISLGLAIATYRFVEAPVRNSASLKSSLPAAYLLGGVLVLTGASLGLWMKRFGPDWIQLDDGRQLSRSTAKQDLPRLYADGCLLRFEDVSQPPCAYGAPSGKRTAVLLGDSHAANWFAPLEAAASQLDWKLLARTKATCRPLAAPAFHAGGRPYPECEAWRLAVVQEIERLRPDVVIVASAEATSTEAEKVIFSRLAAATGRLLIMRDTPRLGEDPIQCLARNDGSARCSWSLREGMPRQAYPLTPVSELPSNAMIIDLNDVICPEGTCRAITAGRLLMADDQHFTASYAVTLTDVFRSHLMQISDNE